MARENVQLRKKNLEGSGSDLIDVIKQGAAYIC